MPINEIKDKKGNVVGHQWGQHGKKYYGKNSRKKAEKQAQAAYSQGWHD